MTHALRITTRTIFLSAGTFCVTLLPQLQPGASWDAVMQPFSLLPALGAVAFTVAAALSETKGEKEEVERASERSPKP